jgi:predicted RecA/RadA family phage recombinase
MPQVLRTATPNGDWRSFKFICEVTAGLDGAASAWAAGAPWLYLVGDSVGALLEDVAFGEEGVLVYQAEKIIVAKSTDTLDVFIPGDIVYWDPATRYVTAIPDTSYYRIGIATEPAIFSDTTVEIDLDGAGVVAELGA